MKTCVTIGIILALTITVARTQTPPRRLQIPGAIPIGSVGIDRPLPLRRLVQQQSLQEAPIPRLRRPIPNAIPAPLPIRPVVEEPEESYPANSGLNLNEEAARLSSIPVVSSTPRQQQNYEEDEDEPAPRQYAPPVQFRPERPVQVPQPVRAPPPQPIRHAQPQRATPVRQVAQPVRRPQPQYAASDDDEPRQDRRRKPEVKILRKYREDNPDGSITWGFENDDGTFKEETIGTDCVTRGKYGYIDPDGNRREYTYDAGLKCDPNREELPEEPLIQPQGKLVKRPPPQQQQQQQYRLQ